MTYHTTPCINSSYNGTVRLERPVLGMAETGKQAAGMGGVVRMAGWINRVVYTKISKKTQNTLKVEQKPVNNCSKSNMKCQKIRGLYNDIAILFEKGC